MKLINGSVFLPDGKFSNADVVCSEKILDVTERAGCDIRTDIQQDTDSGMAATPTSFVNNWQKLTSSRSEIAL